ncbi:MAG: DnaJ family molecular chaperone [Bacteroidota bacterium]|jgi:DnaJ-class molecular chaperone
MGQLFDRLRNYVRSTVSTRGPSGSWAERLIDSEDDELRRIIEELSGDGAPQPDTGRTRSTSDASSRRDRPATEPPKAALPVEVQRAHTTLNVPVTADVAAIKQAYKKAIAEWHPDRHAGANAEQQALAHRRAREINQAYTTLKKFYSIS